MLGEVVVKYYVSDFGCISFEIWIMLECVDELGVIYVEGGVMMLWFDV